MRIRNHVLKKPCFEENNIENSTPKENNSKVEESEENLKISTTEKLEPMEKNKMSQDKTKEKTQITDVLIENSKSNEVSNVLIEDSGNKEIKKVFSLVTMFSRVFKKNKVQNM